MFQTNILGKGCLSSLRLFRQAFIALAVRRRLLVMDEVTLVQVPLRVLWISAVDIIPLLIRVQRTQVHTNISALGRLTAYLLPYCLVSPSQKRGPVCPRVEEMMAFKAEEGCRGHPPR